MVGARDMDKGGNFELEMELEFHNEPHFFTMTVTPADNLTVQVEHKHEGLRWTGEFTARYIEGITQKTGSFKKFPVFVSMLRSAVLQESDSVFVELLSYQDLEILKHRRSPEHCHTPLVANNKRYLILTYDGEFDRVHYPLPLMFEEHPDVDSLTRTIKRQRAEIAHLKVQVRTRVKFPTSHKQVDPDGVDGLQPNLRSQSKCADASSTEDRQKLLRELATYKKKCQLLISELQDKKNHAKEMQAMRKRLVAMQEDLKAERLNQKHAVLQITKEKMSLQDELKIARITERRLHGQIRDKEHALDILKRQLRADPDSPVSPRKPDWVSSYSRSPPLTRSTSPQQADWPSSVNSRKPSPYASRLDTPRLFLNSRGHSERSRSAFSSRTASPRSAGASNGIQERSKSIHSSRSLPPQSRTVIPRNTDPRTNSPRNLSNRMNSPRTAPGSARANSPRNASSRANSPRDNYFRYISPPTYVERYLPHSSRSSRPTSAFSTRENSPRGVSDTSGFRHCSQPIARGKSPISRVPSPYEAYLAANGLGSSSSTRPGSRDSAFLTPNAHASGILRPSSRDSFSPRARTPADQARTQPLGSELHSAKASPRMPPRGSGRDGSESRHGYRPKIGESANLSATDSLAPKRLADNLNAGAKMGLQADERLPPGTAIKPSVVSRIADLEETYPPSCQSGASPLKVLQEVEERLASFAKRDRESSQLAHFSTEKSVEVPIPEEETDMGMQILEQKQPSNHVTRGAAVLDVDSRLHALQNFLQAAKASMKEEAYDFII